MLKKFKIFFFLTVLATFFLFVGVTASAAYERIPITMGSRQMEGLLIESKTYVSLAEFGKLADPNSYVVSEKNGIHTISARGITVSAAFWNYYLEANGRCFFTETSCRMVDGKLYVPIRPLAYIFNIDVNWNSKTSSITLNDKGGVIAPAENVYYDGTVLWLARIIYAESRGEPLLGKIAVGNVVMNRVRSPLYPNTIYSVIFDTKHGVQFTPVANGTIYNNPTADCVRAAKMVLEGTSLSKDILFFMNPRISTSGWISQNREFAFTIGNHDFYK